MNNYQIKPDYSSEIDAFLKSGGVIKQAVNTNRVEFNHFNADEAALNAQKPNSHQNHVLRMQAKKKGLKSYITVSPCKSCDTDERSVASNICLECDRRRFRAKIGINEKKLNQFAEYLLKQNKPFSFTSGGKKYELKIEEIA
ncbi:hypothetical protein [Acinetobacter parvus]|uniref:hypothetical protein n=1 Tax=Acinetobacter parvus TaxID=134533 RepID=UPI00391AEA1F